MCPRSLPGWQPAWDLRHSSASRASQVASGVLAMSADEAGAGVIRAGTAQHIGCALWPTTRQDPDAHGGSAPRGTAQATVCVKLATSGRIVEKGSYPYRRGLCLSTASVTTPGSVVAQCVDGGSPGTSSERLPPDEPRRRSTRIASTENTAKIPNTQNQISTAGSLQRRPATLGGKHCIECPPPRQ